MKASAFIAGRDRLLETIPGLLSDTDPNEVGALVDWLIGQDYMSSLFYGESVDVED